MYNLFDFFTFKASVNLYTDVLSNARTIIREKRKISDSVLWQKPYLTDKSKMQRDNIKNATKILTIADRL